jgi:ATP-dependent helicase HrpB
MVPFDPPEITTSDLSSLALDLAAWGVTDPSVLAWLDPPPQASWEAALRLLMDLDALEPNGTATPMGRAMARFPLHPRLGRMLLRAADSGHLRLGADLAALLSERDFVRRSERDQQKGADISERFSMLKRFRNEKEAPSGADPFALRSVDRAARQLRELAAPSAGRAEGKYGGDIVSSLLLHAFPDRIAQRRVEGEVRYLLSQGRGARLPRGSLLGANPFLVAVHLDSGEKAEGTIHMAEPVSEETIRKELASHVRTVRQVEWDRQEGRILSIITEKLGALTLSAIPFSASDEEVAPILCQAVRSGAAPLAFTEDVRQLQGRVAFLRRTFPTDAWPDMTDAALLVSPEGWLSGIRTKEQLAGLKLAPVLKAMLSRQQSYRLDKEAPAAMAVPSGRTVALNYAAGELPILAVKLQELFGLAVTPTVAGGRVAVLVHLLSPAGRPVQITRDLLGFWENGYPQVKKELQGRYPKHPWPDDPWNAVPTHKTSRKTK